MSSSRERRKEAVDVLRAARAGLTAVGGSSVILACLFPYRVVVVLAGVIVAGCYELGVMSSNVQEIYTNPLKEAQARLLPNDSLVGMITKGTLISAQIVPVFAPKVLSKHFFP